MALRESDSTFRTIHNYLKEPIPAWSRESQLSALMKLQNNIDGRGDTSKLDKYLISLDKDLKSFRDKH